ncbi:MAG: hypothetical protein CVT49_14685 [candidate division Zixibacteria bacterium HGW-Zixibacteria-1]|nr:MAG: hypothetical protein CVT49_14685 [candidate division Zixibacteria bacterium HGW-Zixibacteria-1]
MPFVFYSPDQSITDVTHLPIPGGNGWTQSVQFLNGFEEWWPLMLEVTTFFYGNHSVLGVLPDTFAITCSGMSGWPSGLGEQPYIRFHFDIEQEGTFCIDSCEVLNQMMGGVRRWLFEDPVPSFNGPYCWNIEIVDDYVCGDVNHDGNVNLLDVTYLIKYLYRGGLMPYPFDAGDVNSSDSIEILDIAFMVNYLYKGGPGLHCIH